MGFLKELFSGIYNLVIGLFVTGKHLGRHAITLQYPKERWPMPERSRGVVVLLSDPETGELNCTACLLCMKACPTAAIVVEREKNPETKRWFPTKFVIDNTICCFCGLCEESCNFDAIKLTGKYEFSVYDQSELIYDMDKLAELGRDVKYTPRAKKTPSAKPAPKPATKEAAVTNPKPEEKPKEKTEEKPKGDADDKAAEEPKSPAEDKPAEDEAKEKEIKDEAEKPDNKESEKPEQPRQAELNLNRNRSEKESGK